MLAYVHLKGVDPETGAAIIYTRALPLRANGSP